MVRSSCRRHYLHNSKIHNIASTSGLSLSGLVGVQLPWCNEHSVIRRRMGSTMPFWPKLERTAALPPAVERKSTSQYSLTFLSRPNSPTKCLSVTLGSRSLRLVCHPHYSVRHPHFSLFSPSEGGMSLNPFSVFALQFGHVMEDGHKIYDE